MYRCINIIMENCIWNTQKMKHLLIIKASTVNDFPILKQMSRFSRFSTAMLTIWSPHVPPCFWLAKSCLTVFHDQHHGCTRRPLTEQHRHAPPSSALQREPHGTWAVGWWRMLERKTCDRNWSSYMVEYGVYRIVTIQASWVCILCMSISPSPINLIDDHAQFG